MRVTCLASLRGSLILRQIGQMSAVETGGHEVIKGARRRPRWPRMAPHGNQDGPKMRHTGFQMAQDGPKMRGTGLQVAQEGHRMRQTWPQMAQDEEHQITDKSLGGTSSLRDAQRFSRRPRMAPHGNQDGAMAPPWQL